MNQEDFSAGMNQFMGQLYLQLLKNRMSEQNNQHIPKKYFEQHTGAAKIRFCLKKKTDAKHLPPDSDIFTPKNDAKSAEARKTGNQYFKARDYVNALDWYNRSLCFAKTKQNLGMGYANRSAVYFHAGFYKYCLENIELALANEYPEQFKEKLEKRRTDCLEAMKTKEDGVEKAEKEYNPMQLTYEAHNKVPMMVEGLEFAENKEFGRHIRTNKDVKPGDILIIEKPFTMHVQIDSEYKRCAHCLSQKFLNLIPCHNCTRTMFCSEFCRTEASQKCHKYECPIIDAIHKLQSSNCGTIIVTALHATLQSIISFSNPLDLKKTIDDIIGKNEAFTVDYRKLTEQTHFRAVYSLETNSSSRDATSLYSEVKECALIWHYLSKFTALPSFLGSPAIEDMFLDLFFHFIQLSIVNTHQLGHPAGAFGAVVNYGSGIYTISHLLNHSCMPNVFQMFDKGTMMMVAKRSIKAGEQIFYGYGEDVHHGYAKLADRRAKLRSQYNFECNCKACQMDYPLIDDMKMRQGPFLAKFERDVFEIVNFDVEFAKKKFREYKKYIMEYEKRRPGFELYSAEGIFTHAMWVMMFGRPLRMQLKAI